MEAPISPRWRRTPVYAVSLAAGLAAALLLAACADPVDPLNVTTHPARWAEPGAATFHGTLVLEGAEGPPNCTTCHGTDYQGGTSGVSCMGSGCHAVYPHPEGFTDTQAAGFHGVYIAERGLWDLSTCRSCHGEDYAGKGERAKDCLTCHTDDDGPEACDLCHGSDRSVAPPPNLLGQTSTTVRSVGAHWAHVGAKRFTTAMTPECAQCHVVPASFDAPGHFDDGPAQAEVVFSLLASHGGRVTPSWDPATATCGNVYCHGAFTFRRDESLYPDAYVEAVMTGLNPTVGWTNVGAGQADCGTCHGLPPAGHVPALTCDGSGCHTGVVDGGLNILDKGKHINGRIDVF